MLRRLVPSLLAVVLAACGTSTETSPAVPTAEVPAPPAAANDPTLAVTAEGPLRGVEVASGTRTWKGIPYASPPIGDLRFRVPAEVAPWTDERPATAYASGCMQIDERRRAVGSEACLYLDVWSPPAAKTEKLPVLFWIHGGDNVIGAASEPWYEATQLAERANAVVVTINYRLGAFGWLAHPAFAGENAERVKGGATGNYGLHDAIAALSWVQRNISVFGGDASKVLVFGQSAGASNTCALVASPLARGLFSRAMMLSLACHVVGDHGVESTNEVVERKLGCAGAPDVAACFRSKTAKEIASVPGASLVPTEEVADYYETVDGWAVPEHPEATLAKGAHSKMPMILGTTKDEYASIIDLILHEAVDTEAQYASVLERWYGPRPSARILAKYPFASFIDGRAAMTAILSDSVMHCPTRRAARAAARSQSEPVYRYLFAQVPTKGPASVNGAAHGVDVDYVFRFPAPVVGIDPTSDDEKASDALIASIARFARDGSPENASAIAWPRYDASEPIAIVAATTTTPPITSADRCDLWDELGM